MLRVSLKGLLARKLRLALTALAVALGVTLVAGTYVFTDTINRSFEAIFSAANAGVDVAVTPREVVDSDDPDESAELPAAVLARVRAVEGVASAHPFVEGQVTAFARGERLGGGQAPSFAFSLSPDPAFDSALEVVEGRRPRPGAGEALLDAGTAARDDVAVGDVLAVQGGGPRERLRVTGLYRLAGVGSIGGSVSLSLPFADARALLGQEGPDGVQARAAEGLAAGALAERVRAAVGRGAVVRTGSQEATAQSDALREDLGFLSTALLAFAAISLFVGAFLIYNTFAITVAQRAREIALLRTLGAQRAQVLRSVLAEGLAIGLLGSLVGLALGVLSAGALRELFAAVGVELPSTGTVVLARTVVVALAVGVLVTVLAAVAPAVRATRVAPVEALAAAAAPPRRPPSRRLTAGAVIVVGLGAVLLCAGLVAGAGEEGALALLGAGAALSFLGVALLSPRLVPPLARVVGAPAERLGGMGGRLARENAVRQPGRTAVTAAALMIGVALVAFAAIFATSATATIRALVEGNLRAQLVVQHEDGFSAFPAAALREAATVPGVAVATGVRFARADVAGDRERAVTGVDPRGFPRAYAVDPAVFARLAAPGGAVLGEDYAQERGLHVGSPLRLTGPSGRSLTLTVRGLFRDEGRLTAPIVVSTATAHRGLGERRDAFGLVVAEPGADAERVRRDVAAALRDAFPVAEVLTAEAFVDDQAGQVQQLLGLIYALLSLAVLVSLVGIVNTLVLAVRERTRELGLLRAIGTSRRQVRAAVRWEALITALIGAVLGLVMGTVLALLLTRPLDDFTLAVPVGQLLLLLVVAGVAGVLAAAWPARRAARLDVLRALADE